MTEKSIAVFCTYSDFSTVEKAVQTLKEEGFAGTDISVLFGKNATSKDFAHEKGTQPPGDAKTSAIKGAVSGAAAGGLFAGVSVLAIPALAPLVLLGVGPLMLILAELGSADASGVERALSGIGIPEYEAKHYEQHIKDGGVFLCVHVDDASSAERVEQILGRTRAQDLGYLEASRTRKLKFIIGSELFLLPQTLIDSNLQLAWIIRDFAGEKRKDALKGA